MKPRTHLFVAAQTAFGEAVLGLRIAHELHARGDRVAVLAGDSLSVLLEGTPFRALLVSSGEHRRGLTKIILGAIADVRPDSVVLLDATLVYWLLKAQGADATFLRDVRVPVIGLDVWNTREAGLTWDLCGTTWEHSCYSLDVKHRLVPVPFAKPVGLPGLYNALPAPFVIDEDERQEVREEFGVGPKDGLLPASYPETAAAAAGTGTDAAVCPGQNVGDPNGRRSPADDGRPHRHSVALHRTRAGSGAADADAEAQFARQTAAKDHVGWHSDIAMTAAPVVPTLQDPITGTRPPGGYFGASCERRARLRLDHRHWGGGRFCSWTGPCPLGGGAT